MRRPTPSNSWPESWRESYDYDCQEVFGEVRDVGYANAYRMRYDRALAAVRQSAPPGATVLDIAAAQGNFSLALAEEGYQVTWNDLREELVGYVQLKHETGELRFAPGNAFDLGLEPFDVVLITEIIEHVAHPDEFLRAVGALVKPDGHIVMTTPNGSYFRNELPRFSDCPDPSVFEGVQFKPNADGHIFLLHRDEVYGFAREAGLRVTHLSYSTNFLSAGFAGTGRLVAMLPERTVHALERGSTRLPDAVAQKVCVSILAVFQHTRWAPCESSVSRNDATDPVYIRAEHLDQSNGWAKRCKRCQ